MRKKGFVAIAACVLVLPPVATGHVTANPPQATAEGFAMIAFRVPHGCEDSPTTSLTVRIPEGVVSVTPQAVAGWTVTTKEGKLAQPVELHGETVTEGVQEVTWTGGPLDAHQFSDFGISMRMPDKPGETLWFPAIQRCAEGVTRWIQIPVEGEEEPDTPAPGVTLLAADEPDDGEGSGEDSMAAGETTPPEATPTDTVTAEAAESTDGSDDDGMETLAMAFGAGGLVAGLAALGITWRRPRGS
jgi:uncharacterized protein YcnI